jgi:deoxyguanosine kinase
MEKVNRVILSLGSNIEDRLNYLQLALEKIEASAGRILSKSSIYESEAIGFESDIPFFNMCVVVETLDSPEFFLKKTQQIEIEIGRKTKTTSNYESRKIDIDIIFYENQIIESETLNIPHQQYQFRKFVLLPLQEISFLKKDPKTGVKIGALIIKCGDSSAIKKTNFTA